MEQTETLNTTTSVGAGPDISGVSVEPRQTIMFESGLLGFENLRKFVLVSEPETEPVRWLLSVENPTIGFPVVTPYHVDENYNGKGNISTGEVPLVILTFSREGSSCSANMRCPVIINLANQTGRQVILENSDYPLQQEVDVASGSGSLLSTKDSVYRIYTPQFGWVEYGAEHIFTFSVGLLGFEHLNRYILISEEQTEPFKWLISTEEPTIGFPLISPWLVEMSYDVGEVFDQDVHALYVVVNLNQGVVTANMKAPVVLNSKTQSGEQVILVNDTYSTVHPLNSGNE